MSFKKNKGITVLIPSHNEETIILKTLKSIENQSLKAHNIIVVCDNCTDNTIPLIEEYIKTSKSKITIFKTINNKGKKAGALNQVFKSHISTEFVLVMDADTLIDKNALKNGVSMLNKDKNLAAVCSRAGILPFEGKNLWQKILWTIQHIEYGQFDSHRVETKGKIKVAHGMATLFRLKALKTVPIYRKNLLNIDSDIYLEDNLVEDYEMTLCLKHQWKISSCMDMLAWTDVPLTGKELFIQRLRWLRGGVDTLRMHSFNKVTIFEILNHFLFIFLLTLRFIALSFSIYYIYKYGLTSFSPFIIVILFLSYTDSIYRLKFVQNKTFFDYFIKLIYLPEMIYSWFQAIILCISYLLSYFNIKQRW